MLSTKTLIIARHGETEGDRLSSVGLYNTFTRAAYLDMFTEAVSANRMPLDGIVYSPTGRTTDTAKAFSRYFTKHVNPPDHPPVLKSCDVLGSPFGFYFRDVIKDIPDEWSNVCLVSHAPNLKSLAFELTHRYGMPDFDYGDMAVLKFNRFRWESIYSADRIEYLKGSFPIGQIRIHDIHELVRDL